MRDAFSELYKLLNLVIAQNGLIIALLTNQHIDVAQEFVNKCFAELENFECDND